MQTKTMQTASAKKNKKPQVGPAGNAETKGGVPTEREPVKITTLTALKDLAREPKPVSFTLRGQPVEMMVQPLSGEQQEAADKFDAIIPPKKKEGEKEEYDYQNPAYQQQLEVALRKKKTFILLQGIPGFTIPGETIEAQQVALYQQLQTGVIDLLVSAILQITKDPISQAVFT